MKFYRATVPHLINFKETKGMEQGMKRNLKDKYI